MKTSKEFNRISEELSEPFSEVNLVNATKKTFKATLYTNVFAMIHLENLCASSEASHDDTKNQSQFS